MVTPEKLGGGCGELWGAWPKPYCTSHVVYLTIGAQASAPSCRVSNLAQDANEWDVVMG